MSTDLSSVISDRKVSAEQIAEATHYLIATRDALVESTARLSDAQCNFKPASDRWSIAENIEHIVIVERRVHAIVGSIGDGPEPPAEWDQAEVDATVLREIPNRSKKFEAPARVHPTQHWSRTEALEHFCKARELTIQLLSASSIRGHVFPHPISGLWDGFQWLVAAGAHGLRHTDQINEMKSAADFPES